MTPQSRLHGKARPECNAELLLAREATLQEKDNSHSWIFYRRTSHLDAESHVAVRPTFFIKGKINRNYVKDAYIFMLFI